MRRIIEIIVLGSFLAAGLPARAQIDQLRQSSTQQVTPNVRAPRPPRLNTQMHRARTAFESGSSMMEAKVRVERVLKARPNDVEARKLRAQVLLALDQPAPAQADAQRAASLSPSDGEAQVLLAEASRRVGDTTLAQKALNRAADHLDDDASLHVRLAWTAAQLGMLNRAEAYARTALALNASLASAYYQLARVFVQKKQLNDAALVLERGFRASLLSSTVVRRDTLLHRLTDRPRLHPWLR